jgi:hypothetical protein
MAIQSQGNRTSGVTIANASYGVYPPATVRPRILQVEMIQTTATAQSVGFGRPATIGTPTTPILFQQEEVADPTSVLNGHLTWSVQPGAPTVFNRRWNSAASIGVGITWSFPRGFVIPVSSAAVLWNITAAVALDVNCVADA